MQTHIEIELNRLALSERHAEWNRAHEAHEDRQAERTREDAYLARSRASYAAGEPEEVFEAREAAMAAEQYRITERLNADVLQLFARCAPRRFEDRRAA
jgi:hypothetical protein